MKIVPQIMRKIKEPSYETYIENDLENLEQ